MIPLYCELIVKGLKSVKQKGKNKTPEKSHKKNTGNKSRMFSLIGYL